MGKKSGSGKERGGGKQKQVLKKWRVGRRNSLEHSLQVMATSGAAPRLKTSFRSSKEPQKGGENLDFFLFSYFALLRAAAAKTRCRCYGINLRYQKPINNWEELCVANPQLISLIGFFFFVCSSESKSRSFLFLFFSENAKTEKSLLRLYLVSKEKRTVEHNSHSVDQKGPKKKSRCFPRVGL